MIPILEFSSTTHRDIRSGHPVPGINPPHISGTFCATSDTKIPDHAQEIKFVVDNLIIILKYAVIKPSTGTNENKIVSSASIDAQRKCVYYAFEASDIEYDIGEERGGRS